VIRCLSRASSISRSSRAGYGIPDACHSSGAVDLVDENFSRIAVEQEVDSSQPCALERHDRLDGQTADLFGQFIVDGCRDQQFRRVIDVLCVVVVERVSRANLSRDRRFDGFVSE